MSKKRGKSWVFPVLALAVLIVVGVVVLRQNTGSSDPGGEVLDGKIVIQF